MKKNNLWACLLASLLCSFPLFACVSGKTNGNGNDSSVSVDEGLDEEEKEQAMKEDKLVTPFWKSDVMYD